MYKSFVKRVLDLIISFVGILVLALPMLILVVAIKLDSPGPVLFKQKRVGIRKGHFNILKFRTMRIDKPRDMPTHMLDNPEQWITKVGKFLRKTTTAHPANHRIIPSHDKTARRKPGNF